MTTPGSFVQLSAEMVEESPDVSLELEERERYFKEELPSQLIECHQEITAFVDNKLLKDPRVFQTMLEMEKLCVGDVNNYFGTVQDDLTPQIRRNVAIWMFEVCEEERMRTAVFIRAAQYMDKFLSKQRISRTQLQLLGAVCILISSKMAGTTIPARTLVDYTADNISGEMLLEWEGFMLGLLQWDINGIVSVDFVNYILNFLPKQLWDNSVIYERIKTFISYCAVDYQLGVYLPSTVASASIVAAMSPYLNAEARNVVLSTIQSTTKTDLGQLKLCVNQIYLMIHVAVGGGRETQKL